MSTKLYLSPIYRKEMKFSSGLTRHLHACKDHFYPKPPYVPPQHISHNKKDSLDGNWEDKGDLLGETVTTANANSTLETSTENTPWKVLFASKFLSALTEELFRCHEFLTGILISDKRWKHPRSKHKNSLYLFNDQLDYGLIHHFVKSEITKGNVNKFLTDPSMAPLTKKVSYKNTDEWIDKLLEIPWDIPDDK